MIINLILNILVDAISVVFIAFDPITTLPVVGGVDIDANLVTAIGWFNRITVALWPLAVMMEAFLFIMGWYVIKLTLKLFLGSRTPGHD